MKVFKRIELFLADADRLADAPYLATALQQGRFSRFEMKWSDGEPITYTSVEPSPEDLDILLKRLRPFVLQHEPTNIDAMLNLCHRAIRSDQLRGFLVEIRAAWKKLQRNSGIKLRINERDVPPSLAAELVLYGSGHFHRTKYDEWEALGPDGRILTNAIFLHWVNDAIRTVLGAADVMLWAVRAGMVEDLPED